MNTKTKLVKLWFIVFYPYVLGIEDFLFIVYKKEKLEQIKNRSDRILQNESESEWKRGLCLARKKLLEKRLKKEERK